jgi:flagellin-like protein
VLGLERLRARRAVSPVIAAVVLVAVAITVAVAISFWMGGIVSQFTTFEKLEIQLDICSWNATGGYWKIAFSVKNTGTAVANLNAAFVNNVEIQNYGTDSVVAAETSTNMTKASIVRSGESILVNFYIAQGYASLTSGTTVQLLIHTTSGLDYMKMVELI